MVRDGNTRKAETTRTIQSRLFRLIIVIFSNGTVLLVLVEYDSVNECTQEINELIKLHMLGVWRNAHEFIRQLAN